MNIIITLLSIIFITTIGYSVLLISNLLQTKEKLKTLSLSFGLGVGLIATQLFIYSRLEIPWQKELLIIPWLIIFIVAIVLNYKKLKFKKKIKYLKLPKISRTQIVLLSGILLSIAYTTFEALIRPVTVWDGWATWLFESKVFFIDGKISPEVFTYINSDYPLTFKLLGTYIYICLGKIDDTAVLLISVAFYLFLGLLFFSALQKKYGTTFALLFTLILLTIQNFVRHGGRMEAGIADLPLAYYFFTCALLFLEYLKKSTYKKLIILNIFLGITVLIKSEGLPFAIVVLLLTIYHIYKKKLFKHIPLLLLWALPYIDWKIFRKINHLDELYFLRHSIEISTSKTINAILGTTKELINIKTWNLLWITYIYTIVIQNFRKNKEDTIINILILSQFAVYMFMYIFTFGNNPESSIERLLLHLAPLALYYIASVTSRSLKNGSDK